MTVPTPEVPNTATPDVFPTDPTVPTTDPNVPAPATPPVPGDPNVPAPVPTDPSQPQNPAVPDNAPVGAPAPAADATPAPTTDANPDAQPTTPEQPAPAPNSDEDEHRFDEEGPHPKTVSQVAHEVINGAWGNGDDRRDKLARAGYDYQAVQNEVNAIMHGDRPGQRKSLDRLSDEVLNGEWGDGAERERRLIDAGYSAQAVQIEVNRKVRERDEQNQRNAPADQGDQNRNS